MFEKFTVLGDDGKQVQVVEVADPRWTEAAISHLQNHPAEYGALSRDKIQAVRDSLAAGTPSRRVRPEDDLFEIRVDGQHVGDIVLYMDDPWTTELDVATFADFRGHGYARLAVKELLGRICPSRYRSFQAMIRTDHPKPKRIAKLLAHWGFVERDGIWIYEAT